MANIGNGENASVTTQKANTVEPSIPSRQSGKRSTKGTRSSITPAEAVELLTSALAYCNDAGIEIEGYNDDPVTLVLVVPGAQYDPATQRVVLAR